MSEYIKPPTQENYVNVSEMLPLDYWFGSTYRGIYWNRMQFNMPLIEDACRIMAAPPIVLSSTDWKPPKTDVDVDMAGVNEAELKKVGLNNLNQIQKRQYDYFELTELPQTFFIGELPVSIGWNLGINSSAINYDIETKYPFMENNKKEKLFQGRFNQTIWGGLSKIALLEMLDVRNNHNSFGRKAFDETSQSLYSLLLALYFKTPALLALVGRTFAMGIVSNLRDFTSLTNADQPYINSATEKSNIWREVNFPERYSKEYHGPHRALRMLGRLVPGGYVSESMVYHLYAKLAHYFNDEEFMRLDMKS